MKVKLTRYGGQDQHYLNGTEFRVVIDDKSKKAVYLHYKDIHGDMKSVGLSNAKSIEFKCKDALAKSIGDANLIVIAEYLKEKIQEIVDNPKVLNDA